MSASEEIEAGLDLIWGSAFVQENPKKAYQGYHPTEYAAVKEYLAGGVEPLAFTSDLGRGLAKIEAARRTLGEPPPPPPPPPPAGTKTGVSFMRWSNGELPLSHLTDYDTVMTSLGGAPAAGASAAKRAIVYNSAITCSYSWANVVEAAECRAKGWGLKAADGSELTNVSYGGAAAPLADPGNVEYQQAWAQRVVARCQQYGLAGVFVDDVLRTPSVLAGKMAAKYPTWQQYEAAMVGWSAFCGKYLRDRGYYIVLNAGGYVPGYNPSNDGTSDVQMWSKHGPHVDGLMAEYWMLHSSFPTEAVRREGPEWWNSWSGYMRLPALCDGRSVTAKDENGVSRTYQLSRPIDFYNLNYSTNPVLRDYSLACTLLEARGSFTVAPRSVSQEWWTPACSRAIALGDPLGLRVKNGNRWERQYQNGLVWVDPVAGTSGIS